MRYKVRIRIDSENDMSKKKNSEKALKELLAVLPTLKKHKIEGEIMTKVRQLRNGRKSKSRTLELTRDFQGQSLIAAAPLKRETDKIGLLTELKKNIQTQIKDIRKANRPPIEEAAPMQHGVTVKKLAEVYLEHGSFIKVLHKKIRLDMTSNRGKKPGDADKYLGIELEFASKRDINFIADRLFNAGVGKYCQLGRDGSIKADTNYPHQIEVRILVRQSEYEKVITSICDVLNRECDVRVDKSCGLHVHMDMRSRDYERAFHNLVLSQQFLYAMLPANRRSSNYSYPVKGTKWRIHDDHYHGINTNAYGKYQTIEARMHCGTTQSRKINGWIALLLAIADAPKFASAPITMDKLQEFAGFGVDLRKYVESRIAKFREQHKTTKPTAEEPGTMPEIEAFVTQENDTTVVEQSEVA